MSDAIVTEGISKKYGNITALDGVTLSVPSGMLFGLIGPDGAGKTTLYKILSTLLLPDNGAGATTGWTSGGITVKSGRPSDICPKGSLSIPI